MGDSKEKTQKTPFLKGVKHEFKKIIWPDKKSVARQTTTVVIISVILGILIKFIDMLVQYGFSFIF